MAVALGGDVNKKQGKKKKIATAKPKGVHAEQARLLPTRILIQKICKDHHTKGVFSPG